MLEALNICFGQCLLYTNLFLDTNSYVSVLVLWRYSYCIVFHTSACIISVFPIKAGRLPVTLEYETGLWTRGTGFLVEFYLLPCSRHPYHCSGHPVWPGRCYNGIFYITTVTFTPWVLKFTNCQFTWAFLLVWISYRMNSVLFFFITPNQKSCFLWMFTYAWNYRFVNFLTSDNIHLYNSPLMWLCYHYRTKSDCTMAQEASLV